MAYSPDFRKKSPGNIKSWIIGSNYCWTIWDPFHDHSKLEETS